MPARKGVRTRKKIKTASKRTKTVQKRSTSRNPPQKFSVKKLSPSQIFKQFEKQRIAQQEKSAIAGRKQAEKEKLSRAKSALRSFKPKKTDKGQLIFISSGGKPNPHYKGKRLAKSGKVYDRKGYLVYVTKTGKKQLVKQNRYGYSATSFSNLRPPLGSKFTTSRQKLYAARTAKNKSGKAVILARGSIVPKTKQAAWTDAVIDKFSTAIEKQLNATRGQKRFNIKILIKLAGIDQPVQALIPIDKPDNVTIDKGGEVNFVRKTLYAEMSDYLAKAGYVTSGSANHVRSLPFNQGKTPDKWTVNKQGKKWDRWNKEIVSVEVFEWIFEKVKYTKAK